MTVARQNEADVVIVGGGGAGLAAASSAARLGCKVVLFEKAPALGGTTAWSVGSISATGTPHQRHAGIEDGPDAHFEDLALFAGTQVNRDNLVLRRLLVDNIAETFDWLLSTGLVFAGPSMEPPHRVPRMHNVLPSSRAFPLHLGRHCRSLGVDLRLSSPVVSLVKTGDRVTGVVVRENDGRTTTVAARRGVILASGDYSADARMKRDYAGDLVACTDPVNPFSTGDGQRLGLDAGGRIVNGDIVHGPRLRFVPPPRGSLPDRLPPRRLVALAGKFALDRAPAWLLRPFLMSFVTTALGVEASLYRDGAILVNAQGERFCDELAVPADSVAAQSGGIAYVVADGAIAAKFSAWPNFVSTAPGLAYAYMQDYRRSRRDIFREAATVEQLAAKIGVPPGALSRTIGDRVTAARAAGLPVLGQPPYIALGPIKAYVVFTDGGLAVNERLQVLGRDDHPIPGLYAAGSTGQGGVLLHGHGHHLGWAFVSGRIAGRHAAMQHSG